ncbi:MAG: MoxR family ATPase [Actinomycetia bacterium]|nr:MoxR family ATPase [Actinomycetes bacterium]
METEKVAKLIKNIGNVIRGKNKAVEAAVLCFLSDGHLLIEDLPGIGKTMLAKSIARSVKGKFKRIQFTPDLLPSDITGVSIYDQGEKDFRFIEGPIFANIILADEINRTTPRTQSALLEAMDEHNVTIDGVTHALPEPFFVMATQNPLEYHGTYPLPEGQLDRFLISINLGYPDEKAELIILQDQKIEHPINKIKPVIDVSDVQEIKARIKQVFIEKELESYILNIVRATRTKEEIIIGASPRATLGLSRISQAEAFLEGRDYVIPDDIKKYALFVLSHRLIFKPQYRLQREARNEVVQKLISGIPVPVGLEKND